MAQVELTVPDLGGFNDIPVIEVLVSPGDTVAKDAPLVTLESDKATMEVPASSGGVVKDVRVKIGDKVSQGTVLVTVESADVIAPPHKDAVGIAAADAAATEETGAPPPPPILNDAQPARVTESVVELAVPDIGDFKDIPVIEVLVKPGDTVAKETALVTLESDKATMEVPASSGGTIRDVKVNVGDKVSKGTVIATVATTAMPGAPAAASSTAPSSSAAPTASTAAAPLERPASAAQPTSPTTPAAPVQFASPAAPAATPPAANGRPPVSTAPPAPPQTVSTNGATNGVSSAGPVHASPAIRRFARELGVDLARVRGSGPNGRITRDDVQGYVKTALVSPPSTDGANVRGGTPGGLALNLPPWPVVDFAKFGPVERVALTRIQKVSGPVLARNWVMIPHVTQNDDADVTDLEAFRKQINSERKDVKVTMLAFLMKAAVAALKRYPQFNASLDGDDLVLKKYYHLGFAADTPNGLLVPVIKDVDQKGIVDIARETSELAAKARDGKLGPTDMTGATFTISSLGSIGGTYFTPIINAPEVAILGACKAETRPVWDGTTFVPRLIQPLSLSYDHRVIDGANAARFTVEIKNGLGDLRRVLL
ncbi:MAG: dihydrolipoamide acetyltransferase [Candidatus Eremiobacteraeota bacterium]|nr:dihydrolipoamide acetyltransferase [Candidatus Eremiobacteraeota bacterium]